MSEEEMRDYVHADKEEEGDGCDSDAEALDGDMSTFEDTRIESIE